MGFYALCSFLMGDSPLPLSHKRSSMHQYPATIAEMISGEVGAMKELGHPWSNLLHETCR